MSLTIYKSTATMTRQKMYCITNMDKRNRYGGIRFCLDEGDIPVYVIADKNHVANMEVVNPRGAAYATRKQLRFKKKIRKFKGSMGD